MTTIHFLCGMPFSGNTLLASILQQNPRFEASRPGGILDAVYMISKAWPQIPEFQSAPNEAGKANVLKSILHSYHAGNSEGRPVAFDRSRSWLAHLETAEFLIGRKAKVLVPCRDLREILASLELLWRQSSSTHQSALDQKHYIEFQSALGRCNIWLRPEYTIGLPYSRIEDAIQRGFGDRIHFVRYERLTSEPQQTMAEIYKFLGEEPFQHDFKNIQQAGRADDPVMDFPNVHRIRPVLAPVGPRATQVIGPECDRFKGPYVWDRRA